MNITRIRKGLAERCTWRDTSPLLTGAGISAGRTVVVGGAATDDVLIVPSC